MKKFAFEIGVGFVVAGLIFLYATAMPAATKGGGEPRFKQGIDMIDGCYAKYRGMLDKQVRVYTVEIDDKDYVIVEGSGTSIIQVR